MVDQNVHTEAPPSMAALVQGIVNDAQTLIRQELTLARTEIKKEWNDLKEAGAALSVGGVIALVGAVFLGLAVVSALHLVLDWWASFLIVGGVMAIVGGILLFRGVQKINTIELGPEKTIDTIKEII